MQINYPENTSDFVNEVEYFSNSKLKKKAELLRLFEEAQKNNKLGLFEDLTFTAKYVQGLLRVVQSGTNNPEVGNIENIKQDFSENMKKVVSQIKDIISNADDSMKSHFEENYFELSQAGFLNLSELISDLEWTKKYINNKKRS